MIYRSAFEGRFARVRSLRWDGKKGDGKNMLSFASALAWHKEHRDVSSLGPGACERSQCCHRDQLAASQNQPWCTALCTRRAETFGARLEEGILQGTSRWGVFPVEGEPRMYLVQETSIRPSQFLINVDLLKIKRKYFYTFRLTFFVAF